MDAYRRPYKDIKPLLSHHKTNRSIIAMKQIILLMLALALALPSVAQRKKKNEQHYPAPQPSNVVVVDDEECGCELFFIDGIQTTQRDGLFGFKLEDGTDIVEPQYQFVDKFHGDYCIVGRDYDKQGLIDRTGREIVPCIYQEVNYPSDDRIRIKSNNLYGFTDMDGHIVIQPQYRATSTFNEGLAVVAIDIDSTAVAYGFINTDGTIVIEPKYQYANYFLNGYAVVQAYDRFGIIDRHGKEATPIKYEFITPVDAHGNYVVRNLQGNEKLAIFNINGNKQLTPFRYEDFTYYSEGLYVAKVDSDTYEFLDEKGRQRFKRYQYIQGFRDGFCMVKQDGHYGIINRKGRAVLPCQYDYSTYQPEAYIFYEGLALVVKEGCIGYCNQQGEIVIPIQYQAGFAFTEHIAPVKKGHMWGYIDHQGNTVLPFVFDAASPFEYGRAEVVYKSKVFKINPQGQCLKNCKEAPTQWQ